ncbi:MAG TPA: RloB domain-containing protein [Candidatus Acetothermia bacterium]|nr:RloB domain-containing protein [Candidatus Acetothermia bacterium]
MAKKRRMFKRPLGVRRYRKLFVVAVEGTKTEPQYFAIFNDQNSVIHVTCVKGNHHTTPPQVLKRIKDHLKQENLWASDEAWLVVDKDHWTDDQLALLHRWSESSERYGLAVSNPKFEYWLLLHFEDGGGIATSQACSERLKRYLPKYSKGIDPRDFTPTRIRDAVRRAAARDNPPCRDWPRNTGTTVYRLVEKLLGETYE